MYDYSLSVGDTLPTSYTNQIVNIVTAIDTLWLGVTGHRSFQLSSSLFMGDVSLIEGIGCSLGLLFPMLRNVILSNIYNNLLCVSINNTPVYPENASVCSLVSQEEMVGKDALFSFFLNPFSDELYLKSEASTPAEILL